MNKTQIKDRSGDIEVTRRSGYYLIEQDQDVVSVSDESAALLVRFMGGGADKVEVKPLVWGKWGEAKGVGAKYSAYEVGGKALWNCVCYPHEEGQYRLAEGVSQEAAKAAAQADYEVRIRAALVGQEGEVRG